MTGCTNYRPDHNGECLNCDEPIEAHTLVLLADLARVQAAYDALRDHMAAEKRCDFPEHLELQVDLSNTMRSLTEARAETERLRAMVMADLRKLARYAPDAWGQMIKVQIGDVWDEEPPHLYLRERDVVAAWKKLHDQSPDK